MRRPERLAPRRSAAGSVRRRALGLAAGLVTGLALLGAALHARAAAAEPHRGYEVFADLRPDGTGIEAAAAAAAAAARVGRTVHLSEAALKAYRVADEAIESVNFGRVLKSTLSLELKDGSHAFGFFGQMRPEDYLVDYKAATVDKLPIPTFLAFAADFRVHRDAHPTAEDDQGYGVGLRFKAHTGEFSQRTLARMAAQTLKVIDADNLRQLARRPAPAAPVLEHSQGLDKVAARELYDTLPESARLLDHFLVYTPGLRAARWQDVDYTEVHTGIRPRLEALRAEYPELARWFERVLEGLQFSAQIDYRLPDGARLARMALDSTARTASVRFLTKDGALLPFDADGHPDFARAVDLTSVKVHEGTVLMSFMAKALGIEVTGRNIVVEVSYCDGPTAEMTARVVSLPPPQIEGWALGFIPTWAIDIMIPGNLDEYVRRFSGGVLAGSRHQGSYARSSFDTRAPLATKVSFELSTELIDNFFIEFGMRIMQSYLWPTPKAVEQAMALVTRSSETLEHDLRRLATTAALPAGSRAIADRP